MTEPLALRQAMDDVLELHETGELDAALQRCDALIAATTEVDDDPVVRETAFAARFERALLLTEQGELTAAAEAYGAASLVPFDATDPDQRHEAAMALLNRGICLDAIDAHQAAVDTYDELVVRFGSAADPVTRDQVIRARVNRAAALLALGRSHEASLDAAALVAELSVVDALDAEQAVMARRIRAVALAELEGPAAALTALDDLDAIVDEDPAVRVQLIQARREQAAHLLADGQAERARTLRDMLQQRYADDPDPAVAALLAELV